MNDNRCVCCGKQIPEGRQVCEECEWNSVKRVVLPEDRTDNFIYHCVLPILFVIVFFLVGWFLLKP